MGKIKKLFSKISTSIKETYQNFPITIILIYLLTIIFVVGYDFIFSDEILERIMLIGSLTAVGTFFSENYCTNKKTKTLGTIISLIVAVIFDNAINSEIVNEMLLARILTAYVSTALLLTLYKLVKKSEIEFKEYVIKVFANLFKTGILYAILNIGIIIVFSVFIVLILDGDHWDVLWRVLELIVGFYYIPALINSFSNTKEDIGKFVKNLILYVCTPLVLILISIIYLYLVKIAFSGELLHKSLFFILSLIFATAFPLVVMLKNYEENKVIRNIVKSVPFLYIPCIILQIYAMGIRVSEYGLTESRYMAYMLVILEIIFMSLLVIKNSKYLNKSILVLIGLILIGTITPLNFENVTNISQVKRMEKYLETVQSFDELSEKEKSECYSVYRYFRIKDSLDYLKNKIGENKVQEISEYKDDYYYYEETKSAYYSEDLVELDVSEYSKLYKMVEDYSYNRNNDYSKFRITNDKKTIYAEVDLESFVQKMIDAKENSNLDADEIFRTSNVLKTNDSNYVFVVTYLSTTYSSATKEIDYLNVSGYILEK